VSVVAGGLRYLPRLFAVSETYPIIAAEKRFGELITAKFLSCVWLAWK
jgi:hypothetical protein